MFAKLINCACSDLELHNAIKNKCSFPVHQYFSLISFRPRFFAAATVTSTGVQFSIEDRAVDQRALDQGGGAGPAGGGNSVVVSLP